MGVVFRESIESKKYTSVFAAISLLFFALISGCATTPKPEREVCRALKTWIEAGPRSLTNDRRLIMPNSSECYWDSGPEEVVMTCLTTNLDCPKDVECEDAADRSFRKALFRPAHYWTEYDYFSVFSVCLGATKTRSARHSDEAEQDQAYLISRKNREISLNSNSADRTAEIIVNYSGDTKRY